ncbi:hypothetical protein BN1221_02449c [Brenneria goodwinii]|uniref:Uncharacterized protein n=1 Tax=Brenneria goodwinii TaxID=1109412 RepID=A0A0G4JVR8_9GAMM|nr:hypothetical protein BN1221_02449c [Brenneria goodwinii]
MRLNRTSHHEYCVTDTPILPYLFLLIIPADEQQKILGSFFNIAGDDPLERQAIPA